MLTFGEQADMIVEQVLSQDIRPSNDQSNYSFIGSRFQTYLFKM